MSDALPGTRHLILVFAGAPKRYDSGYSLHVQLAWADYLYKYGLGFFQVIGTAAGAAQADASFRAHGVLKIWRCVTVMDVVRDARTDALPGKRRRISCAYISIVVGMGPERRE